MAGRGRCIGCDRSRRLRADGRFQRHNVGIYDGHYPATSFLGWVRCPGSYRAPGDPKILEGVRHIFSSKTPGGPFMNMFREADRQRAGGAAEKHPGVDYAEKGA